LNLNLTLREVDVRPELSDRRSGFGVATPSAAPSRIADEGAGKDGIRFRMQDDTYIRQSGNINDAGSIARSAGNPKRTNGARPSERRDIAVT
jgi:hypothetical protein